MPHHGSLGHFQVSMCCFTMSMHMHSLLPSLPVVTLTRDNSGGAIHPSLLQSKDSPLLPDKSTNSTAPLEAGFRVATRTILPLSSVTGSLTGKQITHVHPAPSKHHISHLHFLSCFTTSSYFLLSLFCLTELLYLPPVIFSAILSP